MRDSLRLAAALLPAVLVCALAGAARADVRLAVSPESLQVSPGGTFTLELVVPVAGSAFNAFDAIVEYDPAVLTFLPTSPLSLQQGVSMTGVCGNTFHVFHAAGDSLVISDGLLCPGATLTGPARLYVLHFASIGTPALTHVRLRRVQFYKAGFFVNPAVTSDATILSGVVLDAGSANGTAGVRLAVRANPGRGEQWLDVASPLAGEQRLVLYDAAGRAVRHLDAGTRPAGTRAVRWDGRDDAGHGVPPGVYLVRFAAAGRSLRATLVRLP